MASMQQAKAKIIGDLKEALRKDLESRAYVFTRSLHNTLMFTYLLSPKTASIYVEYITHDNEFIEVQGKLFNRERYNAGAAQKVLVPAKQEGCDVGDAVGITPKELDALEARAASAISSDEVASAVVDASGDVCDKV